MFAWEQLAGITELKRNWRYTSHLRIKLPQIQWSKQRIVPVAKLGNKGDECAITAIK